jgi:uncharacterized protein YndB with AHSA1/START domain
MIEPFVQTLEIKAPPEDVFAYFTDPTKLVRWMGDYARLDARDGGEFSVDINGVLIRGAYVSVTPVQRIEIAWGELGNTALPPGTSRVVIELLETSTGTHLTLTHTGLPRDEAVKHAMGWPHFLERMVVCAQGGEPGRDPWAESSAD